MQKSSTLPNQMTEIDIENPYFYRCEKTSKNKYPFLKRKFENQKSASLYFANIKRRTFLFFQISSQNWRFVFFLTVFHIHKNRGFLCQLQLNISQSFDYVGY